LNKDQQQRLALTAAIGVPLLVIYSLATGSMAPRCAVGERCIIGYDSEVGIPAGLTVVEHIPALNAVVVEETAQVRVFSRAEGVRYTETDGEMRLIEPVAYTLLASVDPLVAQWHLAAIDAVGAWTRTKGKGQTVAVVDTGTDCAHPDLAGICKAGKNFTSSTPCGPGSNCDGHGHGTHVAGIVAAVGRVLGVSPEAKVIPVKVLTDQGGGLWSDVAMGIVWAADQAPVAINMSLGSPGASQVVQDAVNYALGKGITVVVARGNNGSAAPDYPACYPGVINVTATGVGGARAAWSSFGNCGERLQIAAPGESIASTVPGGGLEAWSGTSMAAPVVSGVVALVRSVGVPASFVPDVLAKTAGTLSNAKGEVGIVHAGRAVSAPSPTAGPSPTRMQTPALSTQTRTPVGYPAPATATPPIVPPTRTPPPGCLLVRRTMLVFDGAPVLMPVWVYDCKED